MEAYRQQLYFDFDVGNLGEPDTVGNVLEFSARRLAGETKELSCQPDQWASNQRQLSKVQKLISGVEAKAKAVLAQEPLDTGNEEL